MSFNHPVQASPFPVDEKAAPLPSGLPPSYQVIAEATSPSTAAPPEPDEPNRSRRRRCYRRLSHFLLVTLFVWLAGRYLLHHCRQRMFGATYHDPASWVSRHRRSSKSR
jgi:hypothetical protein